MNTYKIVETIEDGQKLLTVVPSCWEKDGVLFWPPNKNVDVLRKKCVVPGQNWSREKCIVKRHDIASLADARQTEKHMSQFSDTESEIEFSRQNKAHKRYRPLSFTSKSKNYNQDLGFPTSVKTARTSRNSPELTTNSPKNIVDIEHQYSSDNMMIISEEVFQSSTDDVCDNKPVDISLYSNTKNSLADLLSYSNSDLAVSGDLDASTIHQILAQVRNLAYQQESLVTAITRIETQQTKLLELLSRNENQNTQAPGQDNDVLWILKNLPINSFEVLGSFEESLNSDFFKNKLIKILSRICGRDGKKNGWTVAYKIIDSFISREILNLFSWTGIPKKPDKAKPAYLRYVNNMDAFYEVIKLADSNYTMETNTRFFKCIIKNSNRRFLEEKERLKRSSTKVVEDQSFSDHSNRNDGRSCLSYPGQSNQNEVGASSE